MKTFLFFLLAFTAFSLYAEEPPGLLVEPPLPREGQTFTLRFLAPEADAPGVGVSAGARFPGSVSLVSGPMISPLAVYDPETGETKVFTEVRYTLRALHSGRSVIGPLAWSVRGGDFSTAAAVLEVSRARDSLVPFSVVWRPLSAEVYEGQAAAAVLEMRGCAEITVPEAVSVPKPAGALFEEVPGLGGISSVSAGGRELYTIAVSSWMFTPSAAGRLALPAARVKAGGLTIDSEPCAITVKSLPPEVQSTGAVGKFRVSARTDKEEIFSGESLDLVIRAEGEGNLNYLRAPRAEFEDILVTGPETSSRLLAGGSGYSGWTEWTFRLSPQRTGNFRLKLPAFSWVDPESGFVGSSPGASLAIRVREREEAIQAPPYNGRPAALRSWDVEACEPWDLYAKPYMYAFIIPCGFFFVWGLLRARRKKIPAGILTALLACGLFAGAAGNDDSRQKSLALVDEGAAAYESENYPEALKLFFAAAENLEESPGVFYNIGLTCEALGRAADSVFWLRKAAFRNPSASFIAERLTETEKAFGITHAAPVPGTHPDVFYAVFAAALSAAAALPWYIRRGTEKNAGAGSADAEKTENGKAAKTGGSGLVFACLTAVLLCALFAAGGIAHEALAAGREWGVVIPGGAPLRKIPRADSSEWLELAEGTAVDILSRSGGFALVAAGSGIEGWVEEKALLENTQEGARGG